MLNFCQCLSLFKQVFKLNFVHTRAFVSRNSLINSLTNNMIGVRFLRFIFRNKMNILKLMKDFNIRGHCKHVPTERVENILDLWLFIYCVTVTALFILQFDLIKIAAMDIDNRREIARLPSRPVITQYKIYFD